MGTRAAHLPRDDEDTAAESALYARPEVDGPIYILEEQVGFILRQVTQRHTAIFAERIGTDLTPQQWAALAKLYDDGPCSQNRLGRLTAMDAATIKGVVDRLAARGLAMTTADPADNRRRLVALTEAGRRLYGQNMAAALAITEETLAPLDGQERAMLLRLLRRLR
jgi:DNA-binding MarR family transcriptional regulator